eukprot:PRCOL_00007093-RA
MTALPEGGGYRWLDVRGAREYDMQHLTKVTSTSGRVCGWRFAHNVPFDAGGDTAAFTARAAREVPSKTTGVLVCDADGSGAAAQAAQALEDAGWASVAVMAGGWEGWSEVYTSTGRPAPPKGKWVSTGTEALKSGLGVGNAALTYEEGGYSADGKSRLQP